MRRKECNTRKQKIEDNDRVVANMNVDGMPYNGMNRIGIQRDKYKGRNTPLNNQVNDDNHETLPELSKNELRQVTFSATLAGLVIGSVFLIIFFLFIMFCIHIWF